MRESNFAFPAQNRACVCISSQLYDRRALDTNSPLPLFNSLTHLVYLTSTSPRIREIMTMDGGLERLVRILHDFCMCPPPPENPSMLYGLAPPGSHPAKLQPTLNPKTFDKHSAWRFSLAFQCVVNIGVRGSEPIRSRVVQAGTLDVVGCVLEAWLANKGFAVGPSIGANGMPRETREQRLARRQAQTEMRQREQVAALARALERQVADEPIQTESAADTSAETSSNATPIGSNTPTGSVVVPGRDRSGTIIARPIWDQPQRRAHRSRPTVQAASQGASTSTSAANSRPETETEDDGDVDMDRASSRDGDGSSPDPTRGDNGTVRGARRAVGIVSDTTAPAAAGASLEMNTDAHIIINDQGVAVEGVGVEDGIVSLEANDDFAMGAPPGAPGAIDGPPPRTVTDTHGTAGERTPRAGTTNLPMTVPPVPAGTALRMTTNGGEGPGARASVGTTGVHTHTTRGTNTPTAPTGANAGVGATNHHHPRDPDSGPYRDEDVLLSLQLLAYLSKYPHVRQAFYKPRTTFHPASAQLAVGDSRFAQPVAGPSGSGINGSGNASGSRLSMASGPGAGSSTMPAKEQSSFMKAFASATGRGKEKEKEKASVGPSVPATPPRMTNVFALVERFTYRHSSSELESSNPPILPPEIQYWAGVIMRNACRKDDSRNGIRQCANMLCGRWESYPREFAKCRRCRKAKYCGKECQSTAWSEGHRFWCSAKDPEEDADHHHGEGSSRAAAGLSGAAAGAPLVASSATVTGRAERRAERERERAQRALAAEVRLTDTVRPVAIVQRMPALTNATLTLPQQTPQQTPRAGGQFPAFRSSNILALRRRDRGRDDESGTEGAGAVQVMGDATRRRVEVAERLMRMMQDDRGEGPSAGPSRGMNDLTDDMAVD